MPPIPEEYVGDDFGSTNEPARDEIADACFEAMVRHNRRRQGLPIELQKTAPTVQSHVIDTTDNLDLAWGADEVAIAIFGPPSTDPAENQRRRRRVFCLHSEYRKAVAEAKARKRPPPPNMGWISVPDCNRVVISRVHLRAFFAAQLGERQ